MLTDTGLRLATAEAPPGALGAGVSGIGPTSAALNLDLSGLSALNPGLLISQAPQTRRNFLDIGAGQQLTLAINVDVALTCGTFGATLELALVTLPIKATELLDTAGGAGRGKLLTATKSCNVGGSNAITFVGHGLPLGTPIYFTALGTVGTLAINTIYYVVPVTADTFRVAASLEDAIASPPVLITPSGSTANVTLSFIPTPVASTGALQLFNAGVPTHQGPFRLDERIMAPMIPRASATPGFRLPDGGTEALPLGAGPKAGVIGANSQRYLYLYYRMSAAITAGQVTADLVMDAGNAMEYPASGYVVKG